MFACSGGVLDANDAGWDALFTLVGLANKSHSNSSGDFAIAFSYVSVPSCWNGTALHGRTQGVGEAPARPVPRQPVRERLHAHVLTHSLPFGKLRIL